MNIYISYWDNEGILYTVAIEYRLSQKDQTKTCNRRENIPNNY